MFTKVFCVLLLAQVILARPQFITFKDGKIGVNFGGYHAEAGLGGLLTGNAAHGGLSASAGTPFGQRAGAGLGGSLSGDGRTAGGLFAGATAGNGVGASASLGGGLDGQTGGAGGLNAESHANGVSKSVVKLSELAPPQPQGNFVQVVQPQPAVLDTRSDLDTPQAVVKVVKTIGPKKYIPGPEVVSVQKPVDTVQTVQVQPQVQYQQPQQQPQPQYQPQNDLAAFDYRKFLDFSFFANTAAQFGGGSPVVQQPAQTYTIQKQFVAAPPRVQVVKQYVPLQVEKRIEVESAPPPASHTVIEQQPQIQPQPQPQQQITQYHQELVPSNGAYVEKSVVVSPFVLKKHLRRRLVHPKRIFVQKEVYV